MIRIYVYTLGCRLNQCESEAITDAFISQGFQVVRNASEADLVIVNTCTVTSKAEQKARRMIRLFARTARALIITGCYAEMDADEIEKLSDKLVIFDLRQKASILELPGYLRSELHEEDMLLQLLEGFKKVDSDPFRFDARGFNDHSRAYLKIQDGCDNHCGYCRTSIARGSSISLDSEEVVRRALKLEAEGFHEIMLTGVNLTMYNHENGGLGELCEKLLAALGPDMRLRFSSMEADHVDDRLLECCRDERIQPHFHLPIQSASNKVLSIANRKYQIEKVKYIVERLREVKNDPFIACDIITGLPGEGEEEFQETYDFLEKYSFAAFHVFPYSPRKGTDLYGRKDRPEERVRDERAEKLRKLSQVHQRRYLSRQEGRILEVLVEVTRNGLYYGTTGNYLKAEVVSRSGRRLVPGSLEKGVVESISPVRIIVE